MPITTVRVTGLDMPVRAILLPVPERPVVVVATDIIYHQVVGAVETQPPNNVKQDIDVAVVAARNVVRVRMHQSVLPVVPIVVQTTTQEPEPEVVRRVAQVNFQ